MNNYFMNKNINPYVIKEIIITIIQSQNGC